MEPIKKINIYKILCPTKTAGTTAPVFQAIFERSSLERHLLNSRLVSSVGQKWATFFLLFCLNTWKLDLTSHLI